MKVLFNIILIAILIIGFIFCGATLQCMNRFKKELRYYKKYNCWPVIELGILEKTANFLANIHEEPIPENIKCKDKP